MHQRRLCITLLDLLATTLRSPVARWLLTRHHGPPGLMSELAKQLVS